MNLKLSESTTEWRKFAAGLVVVLLVLSGLLWWRRGAQIASGALLIAALATVAVAVLCPRWIRPIYRGAMTVSFHIGQVMGRVLLGLIFILLVTPIALLARIMGKEFLQIRRDPNQSSYWHPAKAKSDLNRQF